ncbi:MAG: aldo/keto reductase [Verrucomicrobia bacterium]|nr:aldo/keto reductase [Verrucomicrobiota bacterium]
MRIFDLVLIRFAGSDGVRILDTDCRRIANEKVSIQLTKLTLGCWAFAGGVEWGDQDEDQSIETIHAALDHGITSFDTAPMYGMGESERILGKALKGRRDETFIANKISDSVSTASAINESCETSLKLLQTDVIDLIQVHWADHQVPFEETVGALEALRESGKVKHIGVCNFGVIDSEAWLAAEGEVYSNQLPYSLLSRAIEFEIIPQCLKNQIGILAYCPIMQGLLTGKFKSASEVPDGRARSRHFNTERTLARHGGPGCEEDTFAAIHRVGEIAQQLGISMGTLALAWVVQQPAIASAIIGARNPQQIIENTKALEVSLDDQTCEALEAATDAVKTFLGTNPDLWAQESRFAL